MSETGSPFGHWGFVIGIWFGFRVSDFPGPAFPLKSAVASCCLSGVPVNRVGAPALTGEAARATLSYSTPMSHPVALVTGASRGIGRAAALALSGAGYRVAGVARSMETLQAAIAPCGADALAIVADVSEPAQCERAVVAAVERFGRLDALVHVAGVAPVRSIEEMSIDEWHATIDTNLSAAFYLARAAWRHLKRKPSEASTAVVNISSLASRDPFPGFAAYGAAKAGVNLLGLALAREGAACGIRVHTIAPGAVETAMFRAILSEEQFPREKTLSPEEVAEVIVSCVRGDLRYTSGEVIYLQKSSRQ